MEKELRIEYYNEPIKGVSMFSCEPITIIGERLVELEDGRIVDQYLYNIDNYTAKNGKPFASLKANIIVRG